MSMAVAGPVTTKPTVAQLLLGYLRLEGVTHLFGVPGGALGALLTELKDERDDFTYVICRHETGAAYMADGFARLAGVPGVVTVTSGPGATNALTGSMNAQASGTPLLAITGEVAEEYFGKGYLQEGIDAKLNIAEIFAHAVGFSAVITNPSNATTLIEEALRAALGTPGQAAHLSLPNDVSGTQLGTPSVMPESPEHYRASSRPCDSAQLRQAFDLLVAARRPLILLGNGARQALAMHDGMPQLCALVEKFAIPVITTPDAKALFPESHALSLRNFGAAFCEWPQYYLNADGTHFDALLVLGSGLGELATNKWDERLVPDGPFMQVDIDPNAIGRGYPVDLGIVSDVGAAIEELAALAVGAEAEPVSVQGRRDFVAGIKRDHSPWLEPAKRDSDRVPILPQSMIGCLNERLPAGAQVFVDAGNCVGWCVHYLSVDPPAAVHPSLNMGPMGFAVGATIGAKLAAPDVACIGVVGDGAFLMHGAELSTAARYGAGAIFVVLYDDDLGMVAQGQEHFFPDPDAPHIWAELYQLGAPDLVEFSRALGAEAHEVRTRAELGAALDAAFAAAEAGKPQVVVVHIDRAEIPPYYQKAEQ